MKTKITFFIISILFALIILQGCDSKQPAKGEEDEIFVIADSIEFKEVEDELKQTFGKVIYTPQPEELFEIHRKRFSDLEKLKLRKNIIILATLGTNLPTSNYLDSIMDDKVKNMIKSDSIFVINKYDLWANNQLVMILTSSSISNLKNHIKNKKDDLLYYFRETSNKRMAKGLYNKNFEQKNIEANLITKYGWMMYIQADYQLALEVPSDNFVWIRRGVNTDMERWIFVHWIENASPEFLHQDSITVERNNLTKKFFRTTDDSSYVELYDDYKMDSEVNFNGKYALMMQGLWRFNNLSGGGPFINYTFYDEKSRRIYMLDASVFAPKYYKKSILQEVDVLLHSFKTDSEVNPEVKQDILEHLEK
ncbi:MAG: DUF4837 family protein [Ignavibacteriae bacterium]|nr:DUF4837 family protein [Ignavibacteriota bacterium]